jgi:hypothetical protein
MFEKRVTVELVEEYLEKLGLPHKAVDEPNEKEGVAVSVLPTRAGDAYMLAVDPMVEQQMLRFRVPEIMKAPLDQTPADRLTGLLLAIAALNYKIPLGAFAFDPHDGEVVLTYGLAINSNDLRYDDFQHVVLMLGFVLDAHAADLKAIAAGTKRAEDVISQ